MQLSRAILPGPRSFQSFTIANLSGGTQIQLASQRRQYHANENQHHGHWGPRHQKDRKLRISAAPRSLWRSPAIWA